MSAPLPLCLFDFELPKELIAQAPAEPRDASRLLVLPKGDGALSHRTFVELPSLLGAGDLLVVNRTQVIPARLHLRTPQGGKAELLLCAPVDGPLSEARLWRGLGRPKSALKPGRELIAPSGERLRVEERTAGDVVVRGENPLLDLLERHGEVPLPPYIQRDGGPTAADKVSYQSLFARNKGAVAAPTASLHFTERVIAGIGAAGVRLADLVLHVGPGTFLPVREEHAEDVRAHPMHAEWYEVPEATRRAIEKTRTEGGRVIAVGTTCVRALESWHRSGEAQGESRLFIYPPYDFGVVQGLVTNFHLPRSTLLMLVSAFAGRERVLAAYAEAIERRYRFFSYGDAMLVV